MIGMFGFGMKPPTNDFDGNYIYSEIKKYLPCIRRITTYQMQVESTRDICLIRSARRKNKQFPWTMSKPMHFMSFSGNSYANGYLPAPIRWMRLPQAISVPRLEITTLHGNIKNQKGVKVQICFLRAIIFCKANISYRGFRLSGHTETKQQNTGNSPCRWKRTG